MSTDIRPLAAKDAPDDFVTPRPTSNQGPALAKHGPVVVHFRVLRGHSTGTITAYIVGGSVTAVGAGWHGLGGHQRLP